MEKRNSSISPFLGSNQQMIANQLQDEQNDYLFEQNQYLKGLAEAAQQSAKAAEESSKKSFICTILSVIIAGLMFIATTVSVVFSALTYKETIKQQTPETSQTATLYYPTERR